MTSLNRIRKPSDTSAKKLANLFPESKSVRLKRPNDAFDPLEYCVALPAHKKKKSSKVKPVAVNVIVVPKFASTLPKGKKRQKLVDERRVEKIQLKRTMSPCEVRSSITRGFMHLHLVEWEYLELNGGKLISATNQDQSGELVDRRGSLYIREKDKDSHVC